MTFVFLDTNLLILLVVGRTDLAYLASHKRTRQFDPVDHRVVEALVAAYDGLATSPHVLAEASNLLRQIGNPARDRIQATFRHVVSLCDERAMSGEEACGREEFVALGLTDAAILALCDPSREGPGRIELLTADEPLYNRAVALGIGAELYL
jgi:hypothetical protein